MAGRGIIQGHVSLDGLEPAHVRQGDDDGVAPVQGAGPGVCPPGVLHPALSHPRPAAALLKHQEQLLPTVIIIE